MSVEAKGSTTTTCASDTDDGEYETSSEGPIGGTRDKRIIARSNTVNDSSYPKKMDSEYDIEADNLSSKEDNSMDESRLFGKAVGSRTVLTRSESMPVLKNASSTEEDNDEGRVVPTSESSLARQRKMKMIMTRMGPLLSSESNLTVVTSPYTSKADFTDENYEAKKLESRTELPVLQATFDELPSCSEEMTHREVTANEVSRSPERKRQNSIDIDRSTKIPENPRVSLENDDLIDIAENPHPSIKSFYFPPNPNPNSNSNPRENEAPSTHSRIQSRVAKDLDTLLRIDGELGPLRHKLNEITGKFRAMSLAVPSLPSQERYSVRNAQSPSMSGYYLHRAETFGRDFRVDNDVQPTAPIGIQTASFAVAGNSGWQAGTTRSFDTRSFRPYDVEPVPFGRDRDSLPLEKRVSRSANVANDKPCWSKRADRDASNDSCCVTWNNSRVRFEDRIGENPSGFSLIPSVSSSCYKCYRNRVDRSESRTPRFFDQVEAARWNSSFTKRDADADAEEPRSDASLDTVSVYSRPSVRTNFVSIGYRDAGKSINSESAKPGRGLGRRSVSGNLSETLYAPSTSIAREVRVVGTNTELCAIVDRYSGRIVGGGNASFGEVGSPWLESSNDSKPRENNRDSCYRPREEKLPLVSKKDRSVETSNLVRTKSAATGSSSQLISNNENRSSNETNEKRRDADVQCSGFDVAYRRRRKEIVVRRSVESFSRISESDESTASKSNSNKSTGIRIPKPPEKVVVVPIFFIDGLPEPPKVPLFNFTKSTCYLPRTKHRLVQLEERTCSLTRSSLLSDTSIESLPIEAYLGGKFTTNREQCDSGMSFSCVSRNSSSYAHDKHPSERYRRSEKTARPGSTRATASASGSCSESTNKGTKKIIRGMQSTPEDFLCDT